MKRIDTELLIRKPFSLRATALSHGWHECSPFHWCDAADCLQIIERDGDIPIRVSFLEGRASRGSHARVRMIIDAEKISDTVVALMARRAAIILGTDRDLREFHALADTIPSIAPVVRIGAGRLLRSPSMTENIVKTICGTNVNWNQAVKMINRIGQLGPCLREFRNLHAWPTPREILNAGEDYLLNVARVGYRTESILSLCRSALDGTFDPDSLDELARTADTDSLHKRLLSIRGVGPASAGFLLSLLGHYDRVAIDSWTIAYVAKTHLNGKKPTVKQVEKHFEPYGRWRQLVWWFEQWLTWDTAKSMLNGPFAPPGRSSKRPRGRPVAGP